jgi:hypothetical protein
LRIGIDAAEMVQHHGIGQREKLRRQRLQVVLRIEMHLPAGHVEGAARELRVEPRQPAVAPLADEAHAAHPQGVELADLAVLQILAWKQNAAQAVGIALERVGEVAVIAAVGAAAHQQAALQPEHRLQREVRFRKGVGRDVGARRVDRIALRRSEQVEVAVAGERRQREARLPRPRIGRLRKNRH